MVGCGAAGGVLAVDVTMLACGVVVCGERCHCPHGLDSSLAILRFENDAAAVQTWRRERAVDQRDVVVDRLGERGDLATWTEGAARA